MNTLIRIPALVLLLILGLIVTVPTAQPASASSSITLSISPSTQQVFKGDDFTVDLLINTNVPIRGWQADLDFFSLAYKSITEGNFLSSYAEVHGGTVLPSGTNTNLPFLAPAVSNGHLSHIGYALMGGDPGGPSNRGTLCTLTFNANTVVNNNPITPLNVIFTDASGATISDSNVTIMGGNVTVQNVAAPAQTPSVPVPLSPGLISTPGPIIANLTPTFLWNASSRADYYSLSLSTSGSPIYNSPNLSGTSCQIPVGVLVEGQQYSWNIKAHNSAGWSNISNTLHFQTASVPVTPTTTPTPSATPSSPSTPTSVITPTLKPTTSAVSPPRPTPSITSPNSPTIKPAAITPQNTELPSPTDANSIDSTASENTFTFDLADVTDSRGAFSEDYQDEWYDEKTSTLVARLEGKKGTLALTKTGEPLTSITITRTGPAEAPGEDKILVALECSPEGSTFSPAINLILQYDPVLLPDGFSEKDLVMACYDQQKAQWVDLKSQVNDESHVIRAQVSHLTLFAIMLKEASQMNWIMLGGILAGVALIVVGVIYYIIHKKHASKPGPKLISGGNTTLSDYVTSSLPSLYRPKTASSLSPRKQNGTGEKRNERK